jgi:hypothetical protein
MTIVNTSRDDYHFSATQVRFGVFSLQLELKTG